MFNHVVTDVEDLEKSVVLYDELLRPLGVTRYEQQGPSWLYGAPGCTFYLHSPTVYDRKTGSGHVCFNAPDEDSVDAFYAAWLRITGKTAPEERREFYIPGNPPNRYEDEADQEIHYSCLVEDFDGNKIEAVAVTKLPPSP